MTVYPAIPKPRPVLARSIEDSKHLFTRSSTLHDVADVLEVHPGHLKRWLYERPGHAGYTIFQIPKKTGGQRTISVPPPSIKILQNKFKPILDEVYVAKDCVFGFVAGRSIAGGASQHKKKARWILNLDIVDFYPSINFGRILGLFKSLGVGSNAAAIWAHLVTCGGSLPQGAPTSPVLSNMIARQLDGQMMRLARRYHLTYTRYADDLSLSTTKQEFPAELVLLEGTGLDVDKVSLQHGLLNVVQRTGFSINPKKTRLYSKAVRQEITGLTVNEFVNVRRRFIRQLRAMIHAARRFGFDAAGREYISRYAPRGRISADVLDKDDFDPAAYFRSIVYGKLAFVRMVRGKSDSCYVNFCLQLGEIDASPPGQITEIKEMHEEFQVFICHASEDRDLIASPLHEALAAAGVVSFLDTEYIKWGDSFVEKINHALSRAKVVVVILSSNSVNKAWPRKEIHAALAREVEGTTKVLPVMVGDKGQISALRKTLPLLADKHYKKWSDNAEEMAQEIEKVLQDSADGIVP